MDAERELVDAGTLAAQVEDADLGVRDTTVESGLWIWFVLSAVSFFCSPEEQIGIEKTHFYSTDSSALVYGPFPMTLLDVWGCRCGLEEVWRRF